MNKYIFLFFIYLILVGCKFDSLPDKINSDYELALPIINDTLDFEDITSLPLPPINIPAGTFLKINEKDYPFYIADFFDDQNVVEWIDPKFIIKDNLPEGIDMLMDCFVIVNGLPDFFWLKEKYTIKSGEGNTNIIQSDKPISKEVIERIKDSNRLYTIIYLRFEKDVSLDSFKKSTIYTKLGMRIRLNVETSL